MRSRNPLPFIFLLAALAVEAQTGTLDDALARVDQGDLEGAVAILEELRESGASTPQADATLGAVYLEIGLPEDALAVLGPLAESADADPAVLYNAGRAALAAGQDERGEAWLERSLAREPRSPAARLLGMRLGARGRLVASYRLLAPWAASHPDDVEARLAAAVAALKLERLPEAEALLAGLDVSNPRVRLLSADAALKRRQPEAALELLEPLRESAPPEMAVDVAVLLATAQLELGRSADAVALLAGRGGEHPRLALFLARALYQGGDAEAAWGVLEPWLAAEGLEPALEASIVLEAGRVLVASGRVALAVPVLERAAGLEPWSREAWQELARAYAASGQREKAAEAAEELRKIAEAGERAAEEAPPSKGYDRLADPTAQRLAEAAEWLERGEPEEALAVIRQEVSLAPQDLRPRLFEVRTLFSLGRLDEARQAVEAALEVHPGHPDALHVRAVVELAQGEAAAAERDLRAVLEKEPEHVPALSDLALVLAGRGERAEARRLLERVLELKPGDELATRRLEMIEASGN